MIRAAGGFLAELGPFLGRRLTASEAHARLERQLAAREHTFARFLQRAVFECPTSPYRRLFEWAGITGGQVTGMLTSVGIEGTLERLHDAGIHVTLEEFKGLAPLRRAGLEWPVRAEDFDNPLSARQYETQTGGSGGAARRILLGLDLLEHESAYHAGFYAAYGRDKSAAAMWLPAPPGAVGMKNALIRAKLGQPVERWFSHCRPADGPVGHRAFAGVTRGLARAYGASVPPPEYVPAGEVGQVVTWLATQRASGKPAVLLTTPSSAVRTCAAAADRGIDIAETLFVLVGEPFTQAKADVIARTGSTAASHYAMVEAGMIGLACHAPAAPDDVHLVSDKMATIQRNRPGGDGETVGALFHTTLLPASPKVMLNVESGDYGVREQRECGCRVLPAAFREHLHTIRSYEKLTSEGMHFLGGDLLHLLEQVLPARFGGNATDYQLVEREVRGLPTVNLIIDPAVGPLEPDEVVRVMFDGLRQRGVGQKLMTEVWDNGGTVRVVREVPRMTAAGKIQPLQKVRG